MDLMWHFSSAKMLFERTPKSVGAVKQKHQYIKILNLIGVEFSDEDSISTTKEQLMGIFISFGHISGIALIINYCKNEGQDFASLIPAFSFISIISLATVKCVSFFSEKSEFFLLMKRINKIIQLGIGNMLDYRMGFRLFSLQTRTLNFRYQLWTSNWTNSSSSFTSLQQ